MAKHHLIKTRELIKNYFKGFYNKERKSKKKFTRFNKKSKKKK